jgi:hypothetical protein
MKTNFTMICFVIDLQLPVPVIVTAEFESGMTLNQIHSSFHNPFSQPTFL